jgi:hypothetical protein
LKRAIPYTTPAFAAYRSKDRMEGGVDAEERSSLDSVQDSTQQASETQEDSGEDNKFQKAIGAWRSTAN